jgi:hypothetical protein
MELHIGEYKLPNGSIMTGREWASKTISRVAQSTNWGSYPQSISVFDLGRALGRAIINSNEEDPYKELIRGLDHYFSQRENKNLEH